MTDDRRRLLSSLSVWCREKSLEPRLWLFSLFHIRRWLFAPTWKQLMGSEKSIAYYHRLSDLSLYEAYTRRERQAQLTAAGAVYDPNRDLSGTVEQQKKYYIDRGRADVCIDQMHMSQGTLGFHPRSLICARCPLSQACAQRLQAGAPFDILALRRGEITADQAREIAIRARR